MIKVVEKAWGRELWLANEPEYCLKKLILDEGYACSLHYHPIKKETFFVDYGSCFIRIGREIRELHLGDSVVIEPTTPHQFWSVKGDCHILEVSTHHSDDDVVRLEESHKL